MHRLGLALSGGGFRATLYHLGVIRYLRDAGILPKVTHITTVSGGSVLGAHLALNWDAYCGAERDFDAVAAEIVRFVQLDVRNRIVRRFPFGSVLNTGRRLFRRNMSRQLTRAGLLERHYERYLFGDVPLSHLPDRPRLHILTTNLSEGCLCSFNRDGLLLQRRVPGHGLQFERVHLGLATVPMAVAASSAFPGFFPPLVLNGWDVGADVGDFSRQAFTDGGVYDNLGLRMFRNLERSSVRDAAPLRKSDFLELGKAVAALGTASELPENTPLRKLRGMLAAFDPEKFGMSKTEFTEDMSNAVVRGLSEVVRTESLFRESSFDEVTLQDPTAQSLLNLIRTSNHSSSLDDRIWLNRQIVESALRQVIGKPCLKLGHKGFDGILVSDAGGKFKVTNDVRAGGLVRTALRSTDILMDRVWQLELEAFENSANVLFFPIADVVQRSQDKSAPDAEIQRQARRIRTDLDKFSPLEITALAQHGYCVARKSCRANSELFKSQDHPGPPWNPMTVSSGEASSELIDLTDRDTALATSRKLQNSAMRRIWSTVFDWRDWTTFVWIPLLICIAVSIPTFMYRQNQHAVRQKTVLSAIAETSPVYRLLLDLLDRGSVLHVHPMEFEEVESLAPLDMEGFDIISDTRIFDFRSWDKEESTDPADAYSRVRVRRSETNTDNTVFRVQRIHNHPELSMSVRPERLKPKLLRAPLSNGKFLWELDFNFQNVPLGSDAELIFEAALAKEVAEQLGEAGRFNFTVVTKTGLLEVWMLMPSDRQFDTFSVRGFPTDRPELATIVVPHSEIKLPFRSIATFRMIDPKPNYRYECSWTWSDTSD